MALVLLNPHARGGRARALATGVQAEITRMGAQAWLAVPEDAAQARACIAAAPRGQRVVIVGGDGTLHQLLPVLLAGAHEVGLVPAGSGDDCARAFGLRGLSWRAALGYALSAPALGTDIAEVQTEHETRPFISSLAAGFDAAVAQRALAGPAWLGGLPRYLLATLQELAHLSLYDIDVSVDGQPAHQGAALFASTLNTASYGGGMPAVPHASIDDGRLDLLLAGGFTRLGALAMLPRLLLGQHLGHARVRCLAFTQARIASAMPLPLAADGEAMQAARGITLRVHTAALAVVRRPTATRG
jgi:diacylglycerol kinase (ATP)